MGDRKSLDKKLTFEITKAEEKKQKMLEELKAQKTRILKPIDAILVPIRKKEYVGDEDSVKAIIKEQRLPKSKTGKDTFYKGAEKRFKKYTKEVETFKKYESLAKTLLRDNKVKNSQKLRPFLEPHLWENEKKWWENQNEKESVKKKKKKKK